MEIYKIYGKYKVKTYRCEQNAFPGNAEIHKYQTLAFRQGEMHQMALRQSNLLRFVLKLVLDVDWRTTSQSAESITLKTSLNLQELNRFRKKHDLTVDRRCNEGEAVVYTHCRGQMIHTELNSY